MSGKSYTMREMKTIVEYLVDQKLYGEIKGRKMWMDFANTQLTNRTWQSLKETFLKRILPDIHNPYYKLSVEQINSFRTGYDVLDRNKSKLEIHTISDDSNENNQTEQTKNGNSHEGETTAGENIICSKIPSQSRSSADTVILESCYETAEEIQRELESNDNDMVTGGEPFPTTKSLRDCITYSEPLTPMLQEVLDDFASEPEDSDRDCAMEIVENVQDNAVENKIEVPDNDIPNVKSVAADVAKNAKGLSAEVVEEVLAQDSDGGNKSENNSPKKTQNVTEPDHIPTNNDDEVPLQESAEKNKDDVADTSTTANNTNAENDSIPVANDSENTEVSEPKHADSEAVFPTQNRNSLSSSIGTADASLPNNPEALKKALPNKTADKTNSTLETAVEADKSDKPQVISATGRKRSSSVDTAKSVDSKKKKLEIKLKSPLKRSSPVTETVEIQDNKSVHEEIKTMDVEPTSIKDTINFDTEEEPETFKNISELEKPSTSRDLDITEEVLSCPEIDEDANKIQSVEMKNPCLQNVSLYDEQFNKTKYNMSESSDTEQNKKETTVNTQDEITPTVSNDAAIHKPQSESDTEEVQSPPKKKSRPGVLSSKSERDKAVSNMFGFTSGGVGSKRRRQLNRRSRTISHNNASHNTVVSNSSEWTSESESEVFISPPRSRKNRKTKKYLKPQAGKILSLEEEGGLFVMYGKKIYPLIKDGKIVKNYLTYLPESDSEEGESYWKMKYEEQKKKASQLKKLLEKAKEPQSRRGSSPILQAKPHRISKSSHEHAQESSNGDGKEICLPPQNDKKEDIAMHPPEKIKIKFTKNNEEVHLEGHWPQIHPVLEQVVNIFHKEPEPSVSGRQSRMIVEQPGQSKELSSGISTPVIITPVDPEVHEKVTNIEKEIFKEIEERDKEENIVPNEQDSNVTKRAGRPRKSLSPAPASPAKSTRTSNQSDKKKSLEKTAQDATETENNDTDDKDNAPKRQTRTPRKVLNETVNTNELKTMQTRRSKLKLNTSKAEEEAKYMLPPRRTTRSPAVKNPNQRPLRSTTEQSSKTDPPSHDFLLNSIDSTQGYQDSDISPEKAEVRKKKKLDISNVMIKTRNSLRRSTRRRSHPYVYCDAYNDSSNSSVDAPIQVARENSTLNTDVYKSESYQLLMQQSKNCYVRLEPIDETSLLGNQTNFVTHLDSICNNEILHSNDRNSNSGQMTSDVGSSSNVSLPMSPELSVVENMSISKDMLNSIEAYPTINEIQSHIVLQEPAMCSKYMISDVDVSIPLMQQDCGLESCCVPTSAVNSNNVVTESLLKKIDTININDQVTATDTLDKQLHDLLLESAKKMSRTESAPNKESMMDVDVTNVEAQKKAKAKPRKRCSTPRKKTTSKKSVAPTVEPVVEEEHVESYTHSGRKSCPPLFQTFVYQEDPMNEQIDIANLTINNEKPKGKARKKKDIIRVKIQRPGIKKSQEKINKANLSKMSVYTDSGINDSESGVFLPVDDSVDLIHNHSETCLHANDCVGDSVEFVENSKSVITLNDSMQSGDNLWISRSEYDAENIPPEMFCNNAQDMKSFFQRSNTDKTKNSSDIDYHSPLGTEVSNNSLMTEDLSDDVPQPPTRSAKWYLLSEDETTNTNMVEQGSTMLSVGSFGSNLKQLFPVTCAVPDLSTISEMSKENEDSRKPLDLEGLTGDDFNSRNIFDSNF